MPWDGRVIDCSGEDGDETENPYLHDSTENGCLKGCKACDWDNRHPELWED